MTNHTTSISQPSATQTSTCRNGSNRRPAARRLVALMVLATTGLAAGSVLGGSAAGASPAPNPSPVTIPGPKPIPRAPISLPPTTAPHITVPTGPQLPDLTAEVSIPQVSIPPVVDGGGEVDGPVDVGLGSEDYTDPGRFDIDPDALDPVTPDLGGVADDPAEGDAPADGATTETTVAVQDDAGQDDTVQDDAVQDDTVQDGAGAEAAGEQVARQGALAFTGSNSVLPLLGGVLLVAGLLAAGLAAWARRNRSHSAGNRA